MYFVRMLTPVEAESYRKFMNVLRIFRSSNPMYVSANYVRTYVRTYVCKCKCYTNCSERGLIPPFILDPPFGYPPFKNFSSSQPF